MAGRGFDGIEPIRDPGVELIAAFVETDLGVVTASASSGLNLVVRMKNDRRRNATSHIAVMSTEVLFRGNFTFVMF